MHPQDNISSLPVAALPHLKFGFIRRRRGEVSVQAELDSHSAGLSEQLNKGGALASAVNTYVADVCPRPSVIRFSPVDEANKSLDNLNRLPTFSEGTESELVGELLAGTVDLGFEELGASHEKSSEQKGAP